MFCNIYVEVQVLERMSTVAAPKPFPAIEQSEDEDEEDKETKPKKKATNSRKRKKSKQKGARKQQPKEDKGVLAFVWYVENFETQLLFIASLIQTISRLV